MKRLAPILSLFLSTGAIAAACGSGDGDAAASTGAPTTGAATTGAGGATGTGGSAAGGEGGGFLFDAGGTTDVKPDACAVSTQEGALTPANILFVIDRSGSMNCNPPPLQTTPQCEQSPTAKFPGQDSKWDVVREALKSAVAAMPPTTQVGISYFNDDDYCGVHQQPDVALAPVDAAQLAAVNASVDAVTPLGATPIIGGVTLGYAHLHYDFAATGNDFLVLLTDGAETCAPELKDQMIAQTVVDALSVNIRTFVIGAPGSEPARAFLSQIAWAGGTARDPACTHDASPDDVGDCHFDMTDPNLDFATALNDALEKINVEALSCELDVPPSVGGEVDFDQVNVVFDPSTGEDVPLLQDPSPCDGGADGWQYSPDKTKILLCGDACALVKSDPEGKITIELGCATEVVQ